jgi:hypothetical protein
MNSGKKFDVVLMNPPYDKSLHLKFLEKTIEIADNVVSVQPCEFISRTHIKPTYTNLKNKYAKTIGTHLYDLEVLTNNPFNDVGIDNDLGIYILNSIGGFDYDNFNKQYDKHYIDVNNKFKTSTTLKDRLEKYTNQKYFVPLRKDGILERWWTLQLINYLDIVVDGKVYSGDYKGLSIYDARQKNPHENPRNYGRETFGISFNSLNEAINFRDSLKTEAYLFIIAMIKTNRANPFNKLPLFNNYNKNLSNDDIFDIFDIDKSIRKDIINDMQPFMKKSSLSGSDIGKKLKEIKDKYLNIL